MELYRSIVCLTLLVATQNAFASAGEQDGIGMPSEFVMDVSPISLCTIDKLPEQVRDEFDSILPLESSYDEQSKVRNVRNTNMVLCS